MYTYIEVYSICIYIYKYVYIEYIYIYIYVKIVSCSCQTLNKNGALQSLFFCLVISHPIGQYHDHIIFHYPINYVSHHFDVWTRFLCIGQEHFCPYVFRWIGFFTRNSALLSKTYISTIAQFPWRRFWIQLLFFELLFFKFKGWIQGVCGFSTYIKATLLIDTQCSILLNSTTRCGGSSPPRQGWSQLKQDTFLVGASWSVGYLSTFFPMV